MRTRVLTLLTALAALAAAAVAAGGAATSHTVKIPLPGVNKVRVSAIMVAGKTPPKATATNAAKLGSPQVNMQAVYEVRKTSAGHWALLVVAHRFSPVMSGTTRQTQEEAPSAMFLSIVSTEGQIGQKIYDMTCTQAREYGLFTDSANAYNLILSNDTNPEEQLDNAMNQKCTGSEASDPGGK